MKFLFLTIWLFPFSFNLTAGSEQTLVILQTTDIHCHVTGKTKNWLKLATIIKNTRATAGKDNCLLIDCGDTLAGTFAATLSRGEIAVKMLNLLQYDIWIPGNHDYDFGIATLLKYRQQFSGSLLAANLQITRDHVKPFDRWKIFNRHGIKIAVIGLSLPESEKNYWRNRQFSVSSGLAIMPPIMRAVKRQHPDVIILAAHCGLYSADKCILKIARQYPEINLLLGGHTHVSIPGETIGHKSWYVQSGKHANGLAKISIKIALPARRVDKITSSIIPVTQQTPIDAECATALRSDLNQITKLSQQPLGRTTTLISATTESGKLTTVAQLNGQAMMAATQAKAAFASTHDLTDISPGIINHQQAFSLYPYLDNICTLSLTAAETIAIIEEQAEDSSPYYWLAPVGLTVKLNRQHKVVGQLRFADGSAWENNQQRLKIAFSNYALAGVYGRKYKLLHKLSLKPACHGTDTGIKIYQAIADYIQQHSPLDLTINRQ